MKKVICLLISMLMALSLCVPIIPVNSNAVSSSDLSAEDADVYIIHEKEKNQLIDDLFAHRCALALDYEKNAELIIS